jgi:uncharacterized membrane protein YjfL (UPF0719 family)
MIFVIQFIKFELLEAKMFIKSVFTFFLIVFVSIAGVAVYDLVAQYNSWEPIRYWSIERVPDHGTNVIMGVANAALCVFAWRSYNRTLRT